MNKLLSKITSLILTFVFIFTIPNAVFAQPEELSQPMRLMRGLGIFKGYEDGMLHPEYSVNRAEFVTLMLRMLGLESQVPFDGESVFYDVTDDFWAKDNIRLGTELGFIEGYGNGYFGPDDSILITDAVKIIVSALGYSVKAEQSGGYPSGYVSVANGLGITKGISAFDAEATRDDVALLISNSLEIPLLEKELSADDRYTIGEDTVCDILNIKRETGLVTAAFGGNIGGNGRLSEDEIIISDKKYHTDIADAEQYLGLRVEYYYNTDDDKVLYIEPVSSNDTLLVQADDIRYDSNFSAFYYYENSRLKTLRLPSSGLTVLYNGELLSEADKTADKINPDSGSVCFNDTDNDGAYDLVIIRSYQILTVSSVIERGIYGRYHQYCDVNLVTGTEDISIIKDGQRCSADEIKVNDVLSIARSLSGDIVSVIISSRTVEGEITAIGNDDGITYTISSDGGTAEYKMNGLYEQLYDGSGDFEKLDIGDSAVFYLDSDGNIAASDKIADSTRQSGAAYGYLIDAAIERGMDGAFTCRVLTDDNTIENFTAEKGDKIKFGRTVSGKYSVSSESGSAIFSALRDSRNKVAKQMIKYETDDNGAIKSIYLAGAASEAEFTKNSEKSSKQYVNRVFEKQYYVDQKTKVFEIANQGMSEAVLSSGAALEYFSSGAYTVELYDVKESHIGAIAYYTFVTNYSLGTKGRSAIINKTNSPVMLIERVKAILDENGDRYTAVEGYENGVKVQRLVASALSAKSDAMSRLKPGMLIQYETNGWELSKALTSSDAETIMVFRVLHDCNDISRDYYETWDYSTLVATNAAINIIYGEVRDVALPMVTLCTNNSEETGVNELINVTEDTKILRYSAGSGKITTATRIELTDGMRLAVRRRNGNVREIIIIED